MNLRHNFRRNRKGIATVFGMVFFLLITMVVFASFMTILNQNTGLERTVMQTRQMDNDKANEQLTISNQGNTINTNSVTVNCNLTNTGNLPVQVIRLWVHDLSNNSTGSLQVSSTDGVLQQGRTKSYSGTVNLQMADPARDQIRFWFVTARGNHFTLGDTGSNIPTIESGTGGEFYVGPFVLRFSNQSFQFTADNSPPSPSNPAGSIPDVSVPQPAFQLDNDNQRICFDIQIENAAEQNIEISRQSFFLVEVRELLGDGDPGTTEYERYFHIVGPSSTYSSLSRYNPDYMQVLPAGEITTLKFGSETVGGNSFLNPENEYQPLQGDGDNGDNSENLCWAFLVLFWRYQGSQFTFGQTITYVAIQTLP
jgi:hypothetical protein